MQRRRRRTLDEAEIVTTAIALADAEGYEAVSFRRLAQELGVGAMTLYSYVESKDALVALMADRLMADFLVPGPLPGDWRAAMREIAVRSRNTMVAHPWMADSLGRGSGSSPNTQAHVEQSVQAAALLTTSPKLQRDLIFAVDDYVVGSAIRDIAGRGGDDAAKRFERGLEWLLDGIERDVLSARSSAGSRRRPRAPDRRGPR